MKYRFVPLAIVAAALLSVPARAQTTTPPAISVTGEASVSTAPDQVHIEAGVTTDGKTAREASDLNNAAMGKVLLALKGAGIEEKDFQTSRLTLQPQYSPNRVGPSPVIGYRASNRVSVRLRDVTKVANMIDLLIGSGVNDVSNINFTVSEASKLLDEARAKAVADARRKAELYAKAAGVTLGEPLSISEEGTPQPVFRGKIAAPMAAGAPIAQGEETLSLTINVSWAIRPKE